MENCNGEKILGKTLRDILKKRMESEAEKREAQRKRREEPFTMEAQNFLETLPAELQRAADEGQAQKLITFIDIATAKEQELRELEEASQERHHSAYEIAFERFAQDTFNFCRNGGGLKMIEDYCRGQEIICEPTLDIEGTRSAMIKIRFSWPLGSESDN